MKNRTLFVWIFLYTVPALPSALRYVDMHMHVACLGDEKTRKDGECFIHPRMLRSYKFPIYLRSFGVTLEELKSSNGMVVFDRLAEKLDSSKRVGSAVVLAMDAAIDRSTGKINWNETQVYVPNEFVLKGIRKHRPGLFFYGTSINPYRKDALERLVQAKKDGAVLIKWIPSTMNIDPGDLALTSFYRKLVELRLPLLVHTGREQTFVNAQDDLCDPMRLKNALDLGVKIIAAHVATTGENDGQSDFSRLKSLFENPKYKGQLFADISATTQFNRVKRFKDWIQDPLFQGRLVNGTDWPLIEVSVMGFHLTPYWFYSTFLFGYLFNSQQVTELDAISNSLDRDVRIKEFLGVPEDLFRRAETVLEITADR